MAKYSTSDLELIQTSTDSTSSGDDASSYSYITALTALVGCTAAVLNGLCLAAIYKRRLHQEDNRFIFMALLALADMVMGISFTNDTFIRNTELIPHGPVHNAICIANAIFQELAVPGELFALTLLTLDTFLRIELHMRYISIVTKSVVNTAIVVVVVLTLLQLVPFFIFTKNSNWECVEHGSYPEWYNNYVTAVYFVFPFILIMLMHGRIYWIVRANKLSNVVEPSTQRRSELAREDSKDHTISEDIKIAPDKGALSPHGRKDGVIRQMIPENGETSVNIDMAEKSNQGLEPSGSSSESKKPKTGGKSHAQKAFLTATVLIGFMLLSWVPTYTVLIVLTINPDLFETVSMGHIIRLTIVLLISNALINPIVYIIRVPEIRSVIRNFFNW